MDQFIGQALPYLIVIGVPIWILYKLINFPLRVCPKCKGSGEVAAGVFGRLQVCGRCGGRGRIRGLFGRRD